MNHDGERFEHGDFIQNGSFGSTFFCKDTMTHQLCVCKQINLETPTSYDSTLKEVCIMEDLHHPNIIRIIESIVLGNKACIYMEYGGCDLLSLYDTYVSLPWDYIYNILMQVVDGLFYMHQRNYCHRDIKMTNIVINHSHAKIIDFGLANKQITFSKQVCGTMEYCCPEAHMNIPHCGFCADIWSLGILIYACIHRSLMFDMAHTANTAFRAAYFAQQHSDSFVRAVLTTYKICTPASNQLISFLDRLLQVEPKSRFTMTEVKAFFCATRENSKLLLQETYV